MNYYIALITVDSLFDMLNSRSGFLSKDIVVIILPPIHPPFPPVVHPALNDLEERRYLATRTPRKGPAIRY